MIENFASFSSLTEAEIREIHEPWEALQHHPNSDLEHFLLVCRFRKDVVSPFAFSVWRDGECVCIIAGRIEKTVLRPRIGYLRLPGLIVNALQIVHGGILGELDEKGADALVKAISGRLARGNIEIATFQLQSSVDSPLVV